MESATKIEGLNISMNSIDLVSDLSCIVLELNVEFENNSGCISNINMDKAEYAIRALRVINQSMQFIMPSFLVEMSNLLEIFLKLSQGIKEQAINFYYEVLMSEYKISNGLVYTLMFVFLAYVSPKELEKYDLKLLGSKIVKLTKTSLDIKALTNKVVLIQSIQACEKTKNFIIDVLAKSISLLDYEILIGTVSLLFEILSSLYIDRVQSDQSIGKLIYKVFKPIYSVFRENILMIIDEELKSRWELFVIELSLDT